MKDSLKKWIVILGLILAVAAIYAQTRQFEFIKLDDNIYVYNNPDIKDGLSFSGLKKAFSKPVGALWLPMTMISFLADYELSGLDPGGYHLTNLLLHLMNSILVFLVLCRLTGALWPSALVAFLVAVHPIHVESVAWVVERKDVLSALFWYLTIYAYARYTDGGGWASYLLGLFFFLLGCLSKPMVVTLPFILLLLDYWPLARRSVPDQSPGLDSQQKPVTWTRLLVDKIPFLILAGLIAGLTFYINWQAGVTKPLQTLPPQVRIGNALCSYVRYLGKIFQPTDLAVLYPHPGLDLPWGRAAASGIFLLAFTFIVLKYRRQRPYLPVGWFWFLGTLLPVIGLVQAGEQALADRFVYIPALGLYIMVVFTCADLIRPGSLARKVMFPAAAAVLVVLAVLAQAQTAHWRNNETLFQHALRVTKNNYLIHINLGDVYSRQGRLDEAFQEFQNAARINPDEVMALYNLGTIKIKQGDLTGAMPYLNRTLELNDHHLPARSNLGACLFRLGRYEQAIAHWSVVRRLDPDNLENLFNLGMAYQVTGRGDEAEKLWRRALEINPDFKPARKMLKKLKRIRQGQP